MAAIDGTDYPQSDQRVTLAVIQRDIRDLQKTIADFITRYDEHTRENAISFRTQGERLEQVSTRVAILESRGCPERHEARMAEIEQSMAVLKNQVNDLIKLRDLVTGSIVGQVVTALGGAIALYYVSQVVGK